MYAIYRLTHILHIKLHTRGRLGALARSPSVVHKASVRAEAEPPPKARPARTFRPAPRPTPSGRLSAGSSRRRLIRSPDKRRGTRVPSDQSVVTVLRPQPPTRAPRRLPRRLVGLWRDAAGRRLQGIALRSHRELNRNGRPPATLPTWGRQSQPLLGGLITRRGGREGADRAKCLSRDWVLGRKRLAANQSESADAESESGPARAGLLTGRQTA